ncbi:hypothetical protein XELAEV_18043116mg [Xenopus laevis]|uniref:IF rod domain-containing protein n=2 Tax=Xenopus laevis TaxID=8355 RepID=A0A974BWC1_XENLA|nr:hypothetical protein XELAEV_18043116mg [Xenopus laevis]
MCYISKKIAFSSHILCKLVEQRLTFSQSLVNSICLFDQMYKHVVVKGGQFQVGGSDGGKYRKISVGGYASSVYAGAGGLNTRISTDGSHGELTTHHLYIKSFSIGGNEKETMQNLNTRLATYLEKVSSLEKANAQLEGQIREWYQKNSGFGKRNDNHYFQIIEELTQQIINAKMENGKILLQMDNARLALDDFKMKLEYEQNLSSSVEKDLSELRKVIDDLTMTKTDLESQTESLKEEMIYLKKNHAEEMEELGKQKGAIDVEVNAAPSVNLGKTMEDMRSQYEQLVEKQRLEAKYCFDKKVEEWNKEVQINTSEIENYRKELSDIKHKVQDLEIEAQAELSKKKAAENAQGNVNSQYTMELADKQEKIARFEELLQQTRKDVGFQIQEFSILFDLKNRLEAEISTYRRLLDAEGQ